MKMRFLPFACCLLGLVFTGAIASAQNTGAAETAGSTGSSAPTASSANLNTQAAAAVASGHASPRVNPPDFLEHLVDSILSAFNMRTSGNSIAHYSVAAALLIIALLARRIVIHALFPIFRRFAARTRTTLDDKLFAALESPVAAFIMLVGMFSALKVLKLTVTADQAITYGSRVAFSLVIFWALWRALGAAFDQASEYARAKQSNITTFMPWIRKSVLALVAVFAVLLTIQSLGYDVRAILAGLGIGGLAFALAAQDTLANIFGAVVVAVDQPFRLGEAIRIQGNVGGVEDIGVRSTRIRLTDGSLMVIPNKIVAAEAITNFSRFTKRRFEQVIGLTYDTKPDDLNAIVEDIRGIITSQPEVAPNPMVYFRDFSASSLDIWIVYEIPDPDFNKAMRCKQRVNFLIMRAVQARGLSFAFPTQTVRLEGDAIQKIAASHDRPALPPAA